MNMKEAQAAQMRQPKAPTPGYFSQVPELPRQQILGGIAVAQQQEILRMCEMSRECNYGIKECNQGQSIAMPERSQQAFLSCRLGSLWSET